MQYGPQYVKIAIGIKVFQHKPLTPPCGLGLISIIDCQAHQCDCPLCDWPPWYTTARVTSTKPAFNQTATFYPLSVALLIFKQGCKGLSRRPCTPPPFFLFVFLELIQTARGTHQDVWQGGNDSFLHLWYNFLLIHIIATIPLPSSHHDIHQSHLAHYEWSQSKQLVAGSGFTTAPPLSIQWL